MDIELFNIFEGFKSSFSREATYYWFILVMIGLLVRGDHYGVSSIVRWLSLVPESYWNILHFFNSSGCSLSGILMCWWSYCFQESSCLKLQGRYVLIGDHTNQPKEGRRMPGVVTIHQNSETSSKPGYFRGHVWGFLGLVLEKGQKHFSVPLWAELNMEERNSKGAQSMGTRIIQNGISIAEQMNCCIYLVLDAFFATGPVFLMTASVMSTAIGVPWVHVVTRAKKNVVAYEDPLPDPPGKRGRRRKYGKKIKLVNVFKEMENKFSPLECFIYGHTEAVKILCLDLLWKPIKTKLRFVLAITSRGPIILMCTDLSLSPSYVLELYCRRSAIENSFHMLKNLIGGLYYRFWSKLIEKSSRRPKKNKSVPDIHKNVPEESLKNKLAAIEMFVNFSAILLGILQILAIRYPKQIWKHNTYWLRTYSNDIPSEYIVKGVLTQTIFKNLCKVSSHAIYGLIRSRQFETNNDEEFQM